MDWVEGERVGENEGSEEKEGMEKGEEDKAGGVRIRMVACLD